MIVSPVTAKGEDKDQINTDLLAFLGGEVRADREVAKAATSRTPTRSAGTGPEPQASS